VQHRRGWKALAARESFRLDGAGWRFVYVSAGGADLVGAGPALSLAAGESLVVSGDDTLGLRGGSVGAQLVWAVFHVPA
jgi:hypothetical protein